MIKDKPKGLKDEEEKNDSGKDMEDMGSKGGKASEDTGKMSHVPEEDRSYEEKEDLNPNLED